MEQKRTGLSYVFTLAKEERGKLSLGMLLAVFSSALSFVPYLVVYQILLLIIKQEVTLPAMLGWAGIGIAAAVLQAILTSFAGICSHTAAFNTMHRIKVRVLEHMSKFNLAVGYTFLKLSYSPLDSSAFLYRFALGGIIYSLLCFLEITALKKIYMEDWTDYENRCY